MVQKRNLRQEDWPNFFDGGHLEYRFPTCIVNYAGHVHWSLTKRLSPTFNRIKPAILIDADMPGLVCEDDTSYPGFDDDVLMNTDISSSLITPGDLCELAPQYDVIFMDAHYVSIPLLRQCYENNVWLISLRVLRYSPVLRGFSREFRGLKLATAPDDRVTVPHYYRVKTVNRRWADIMSPRNMISVYNDDPTWSLMEE